MKVTVTKRVEMDGKVVDMSASAEIEDAAGEAPEDWSNPKHRKIAEDLFMSMNFPLDPTRPRY